MIVQFNRGKVVQIAVAFAVNFLSVLLGIVMAWSSPTIFLLQSPDTPLSEGPMTNDEVSMMVSIVYLSAISGPILAGLLSNSLGRKWTLILSCIPQLTAFLLIFFASKKLHIYISRCLSGFAIGVGIVIVPIFVAEISDKNIRGTLGNFLGVSMGLGMFLGKFLPNLGGFYLTPIVVCVLIGIFSPILAVLPESPQFLLLKNRPVAAERALKFYRGINKKSPPNAACVAEFDELKKSPSLTAQKLALNIRDFSGGATILSIITSFWLTNHPTFTGNRIIVAFTEHILRMSGKNLDISTLDISVSASQLIASIIAIFFINRFGSRLVLIGSFILSSISMAAVATFFHFAQMGFDMKNFHWPFVISFILATAIPGGAINCVAFGMAAEIISPKLRGFIVSVFVIITWIMGFVFVNFFLALETFWGISGWIWFFGSWCMVSSIVTFFILPDTRGKTFDDILLLFNKKLPKKWQEKKLAPIVNFNTKL